MWQGEKLFFVIKDSRTIRYKHGEKLFVIEDSRAIRYNIFFKGLDYYFIVHINQLHVDCRKKPQKVKQGSLLKIIKKKITTLSTYDHIYCLPFTI